VLVLLRLRRVIRASQRGEERIRFLSPVDWPVVPEFHGFQVEDRLARLQAGAGVRVPQQLAKGTERLGDESVELVGPSAAEGVGEDLRVLVEKVPDAVDRRSGGGHGRPPK
jgi:hypothetical protein